MIEADHIPEIEELPVHSLSKFEHREKRFRYHFPMTGNSREKDFPYSFPEYLSPILRILRDGEDHLIEEIRQRILVDFPLTGDQLLLRRTGYPITVFVNKGRICIQPTCVP